MPARPMTSVMLATPAQRLPAEVITDLQARGDWWFEIKFDGIRAVITRTRSGMVRITNRREVDITYRYPEVVSRWEGIDLVGVVDGEIIVTDERGRPDFTLAHRRDAQSRPAAAFRLAKVSPATFVPFDILELDGVDLRSQPYTVRRERLADRFGREGVWSMSSPEGAAMWDVVKEWDLEGLVAKRGDAPYLPGKRSPTWIKIKAVHRISALVGGVVPGKGSRGPVGALEIFLWNTTTSKLVSVGKVGSGIRDADADIIMERLEAGLPVVVEVEYLEVAPTGQLRMPTFKGIRTDVAPESCTIDTLRRTS